MICGCRGQPEYLGSGKWAATGKGQACVEEGTHMGLKSAGEETPGPKLRREMGWFERRLVRLSDQPRRGAGEDGQGRGRRRPERFCSLLEVAWKLTDGGLCSLA